MLINGMTDEDRLYQITSRYFAVERTLNNIDINPIQINIIFLYGMAEYLIKSLYFFNKLNIRDKVSDILEDLKKMKAIVITYSFINNTGNDYHEDMENFVKKENFSKYYDKTKNMKEIIKEYCIFIDKISKSLEAHRIRKEGLWNIANEKYSKKQFQER